MDPKQSLMKNISSLFKCDLNNDCSNACIMCDPSIEIDKVKDSILAKEKSTSLIQLAWVLATSKATSSKIDASVIPADPCDLDFFMAKFAAVYRIVFGILILNLIQVNDLLLKVHLSLHA